MRSSRLIVLLLAACQQPSPLRRPVDAFCRAEAAAARHADLDELANHAHPLDATERAATFCAAVRRPRADADRLVTAVMSASQDLDAAVRTDRARAASARERLADAFDALNALPLAD